MNKIINCWSKDLCHIASCSSNLIVITFMSSKKPISVVVAFNDYINNQDIIGLSSLMTEDHTFIDRDGESHGPKSFMINGWKEFFKMFPKYRNTFEKIAVSDNLVSVRGYAYWSEEMQYDPVIWTAVIKDNQISEWRVYVDTPEIRNKLRL